MFLHSFSIPFRIIGSGEKAGWFYHPLQQDAIGTIRAILDGIRPANIARNLYSKFYIYSINIRLSNYY